MNRFTFIGVAALLFALHAAAQELPEANEREVIPADMERAEYSVPKIDTENFEVGLHYGGLNIDDFNTSGAYGIFLDYHVTEDLFIEANYAQAEVLDTPFRRIGAPIFPNQSEDVKYYSLSAGVNVLPGEIFILDKYVLSSTVYVISGLGNTEFVGDDRFTFNLGFGLRLLLTDAISLRVEARDFMFDSDVLGKDELKHNFEFRAGVSFFF